MQQGLLACGNFVFFCTVMQPVLKHGYLFWHILLGHLLVFMPFISSVHYTSKDKLTGSLLYNNFSSILANGYETSCSQHANKPASLVNGSVTCEEDLKGVGSLNTTCLLNSNLYLRNDLYVYGTGNLEVLPHVSITCPFEGCAISFNISGNVKVGQHAALVAGFVYVAAINLTLDPFSTINTTSLGGPPPPQTSGTPNGHDGGGGGHGGRGASCKKSNETYWGGDAYSWSTLTEPSSYGSKGGSMSSGKFGGNGGGRISLQVKDVLYLCGYVTAEGGQGDLEKGGGSGGSIVIHALKLKGNGTVSAAGGRGWGGGGGGRISLDCYSMQNDVNVTVHGGESIGCPGNAGGAGTIFDATLLSLRVSNDNVTTRTETPLLLFPTRPLWSNVYVENNAKVLVPLLWSRVQVRGQISVLSGGSISFGLSQFPVSEFELVAEELLISDSIVKVYGAFRMSVKMLLMWNSKIQIDGGGHADVATSILEVRNLVVLRETSIISSNADLGVYGQGMLRLTGHGDAIKGQRLFLSLFYNITVGPGSLLQAPLDEVTSRNLATESLCGSQTCPTDLTIPPDDCHVNNTLSSSLQICRVEDLSVNGIVRGSILHIFRAKTVIINTDGMITASGFGCEEGIGKGNFSNGAGGGAGHGGRGGSGFSNGLLSEGGKRYGDADLPCELGSGSEGPIGSNSYVSGGGMIVMGSKHWPLAKLHVYGSLRADGESYGKASINSNLSRMGGVGGGSGGTILLFLQSLKIGENASLSSSGGNGGPVGGGGGGGGRVHFGWSNIAMGDEYVPIATINGMIDTSGGSGDSGGRLGEKGTVTGKKCPKGLYGTFCNECPVGTYKDVEGSEEYLCIPCPLELLPNRADFVYVRGGVFQRSCPYKCRSVKYRMPNCYTPLEELIFTFGGPIPFALLLSFVLVLLSLLLSTLRVKLVGSDSKYHTTNSVEDRNHHQFPYLLSLAEVRGTSRAEEVQSHVHRMYFMGPNTFREPWHLPYSPPDAIIEIVYEDAFNRFIDEINSVATYEWWEGSVHSILCVIAYPCAWSWKQWRRRNKIHRLQEYVKSEYDHSCLRSCRSRALYKGMKVGATPDLLVAYIDFFLGGDEKRLDVASIQHRFPMCIIFGGDGSYMSPYRLHSDSLLTNLLDQHVSAYIWNRLVAGLNAQLRTVKQGCIRSSLVPVLDWISTHGNPQLESDGVRIEFGWFHATSSGYYQLGILVTVDGYALDVIHQADSLDTRSNKIPRENMILARNSVKQLQQSSLYTSHQLSTRKMTGMNGGIISNTTLKSLDYKRDIFLPFSLLLHNTRPVGLQDTLQLLISVLLLGDVAITLLTLLQFYWVSLAAFLAFLLILPLSLFSPFPAGLNTLFSRGPRRAPRARVYALWNVTSLPNIAVAYICGILHYELSAPSLPENSNTWNLRREGQNWWVLPTILLLVKVMQARLVDMHIANLEVQDTSLFSKDPESFWANQASSDGINIQTH